VPIETVLGSNHGDRRASLLLLALSTCGAQRQSLT